VGVIATWLGIGQGNRTAAVEARAAAAENALEFATEALRDAAATKVGESLAALELALEDEGWEQLTVNATQEFSRQGLARAATVSRVMAIANPWMKRGLSLRQAYVWGQGVSISARANGSDDGTQDVNAVVQAFLDDDGNRRALTGHQARVELERALGTDGNVFLPHFTNPRTGFVQVRSIPFDEITDIISNPGDRDDPWFYRRQWMQRDLVDGQIVTQMATAFYPALGYNPRPGPNRPKTIDGHPVFWDAPVLHVDVNGLDGWAFGIGDAYAALPFARGYRDFVADWATLVKSLSQFAWRATSKGSKSQQLREKLARRTTETAPAGNPNTVGATAALGSEVTLEAIPKTGAVIDAESGKVIAGGIAAALGVPVTMLLTDPGSTGARAVAETLDEPTRLEMEGRQRLWADAFGASLAYVVLQAVKAPQGPLRGTVTRDDVTGREVLRLAGDEDPTVDITFPALDDVPLETLVKAIAEADKTGKMPPLTVARLLLEALGVDDVDELLKDMTDEQGRWIDPLTNAGQAIIDRFRRGEDPAGLLGTPEPPPDDDAAA
jgi:hypothetical protein